MAAEQFARLINHIKHVSIKVLSLDKASRKLALSHPALPYQASDPDGNPSIASLLWLYHTAGLKAFCLPVNEDGEMWLFSLPELTVKRGLKFVSSSIHIRLHRALNDILIPKNDVIIEMAPCDKWETGFSLCVNLYTSDREHRLAEFFSQFAFLDTSGRRVEIPADIAAMMPVPDKHLRDQVDLVPKPDDAVKIEERVRWDQIDFNGHMNFSGYYDHGREAVMVALHKAEALKHVSLEDIKCGVSRIEIVYRRECFQGNSLQIFVWDDEDRGNSRVDDMIKLATGQDNTEEQITPPIKCLIEKNGKPACQVTLQFFKPQTKL